MDTVTLARALFGSSMAFHIIFATLGVGIPLMILSAELLFQLSKSRDYVIMAKRWTKGQAILLGVGIPSGTIVGVMLSLLWPGFMAIVGQVIALPFQIELWAFFLEALFMSIYVYAAERLSPGMRIASVALVAFGGTASAVLITDAHAWMNTPRGFSIRNGEIVDVHPWVAVFNPNFLTTALHVTSTAYMTGAFVIASIAAYQLLRRGKTEREYAYHRTSLKLSLVIGLIMSVFTGIDGHATAQQLHRYLPEKLAAAEGLFETTAHAPLVIGGIVDEPTQRVIGGIEIPGALSFLAGNRFDTVVRGLNDFPRQNWPPLYVHLMFDLMVAIGMALIAVSAIAIAWRYWLKRPYPRWLLVLLFLSGPLSMLGIETGWIFSCTGRQPWVIYQVQRTADAATQTAHIGTLFALFLSVYLFLLVMTAAVMRGYFRRRPVSRELT